MNEEINIEKTKEILQTTRLIPGIATEKVQYLIDVIKDTKFDDDFAACKRYLPPLQRQVKNLYDEVQQKEKEIKQLLIDTNPLCEKPEDIEKCIEISSKLVKAQKNIEEAAKLFIDQILVSSKEEINSIYQQLFNLDPMTNLLKNDILLCQTIHQCQQINSKFTEDFNKSIDMILNLRTKIKAHVGKIQVYKTIYNNNIQIPLNSLIIAHHLANEYQTSLNEIERRKLFKMAFDQEVATMNNILRHLADEENLKRKSHQDSTKHLPKTLIPGLAEKVPTLNVQVIPFDDQIMNINTDHEEREWQVIKEEEEDKIQLFGNIKNLTDSHYFKRDPSKSSFLYESLTNIVKEMNQKNQQDQNPIVESVNQKEIKEMKNEKNNLEEKINELTSKIESITFEFSQKEISLNTELSKLKSTLENKDKELEEFKRQKDEEIKWAKEKIEKESYNFLEQKKIVESEQAEREKALKILDEVKSNEAKSQLEIEKLKSENSKLLLNNSTLLMNEKELIEREKKLKDEISLLNSKLTAVSSKMENDAKSLMGSNDELSKKIMTLETKLKDNLKEIETLQSQIQQLQNENSLLKSAKEQKTQEVERVIKEFNIINDKLKVQVNESNELKKRLEESQKSKDELSSQNKKLSDELDKLKKQEIVYKNNIQELSNTSKNAQSLQEALSKQQKMSEETLEKEKEKYQKIMDDIKKEYEIKIEQVKKDGELNETKINQKHKEEIEDIQKQIPQLLGQIQKLEEMSRIEKLKATSKFSQGEEKEKIIKLNDIISRSTNIISLKTQELSKYTNNITVVEKNYNNSKSLLNQLETNCVEIIREICTTNENYELISGLSKHLLLLKNIFDVYLNIIEPFASFNSNLKILKEMSIKCQELDNIQAQLLKLSKKLQNQQTVSVSNFTLGDRVVFVKKLKNVWEAFNINYPNFFLDEDSVYAILSKYEKVEKKEIIGNIVSIQKITDEKSHPLGYRQNYFLVTIEFN